MKNLDIASLDPGIRGLVALLIANGFRTADSGDGVSKGLDPSWEGGDWIEVPHVFIEVAPPVMVAEADRLQALLESEGVTLVPGASSVEASYSPADGKAILMVMGVNDEQLRRAPG
jgi:hypothetical protein